MHDDHNHSQRTHWAKCGSCDYVSQTHAHNDNDAVDALSYDLAEHNKSEHNKAANPDEIKEAVREKLESNFEF